jgi:predicted permease
MRHAFRSLWKSPGFTIVAVLALALGIGANTAIFSVVYGVLLRPLPFPEQDRLVYVGEWVEQVPNMSVSYPNYQDWRERQQAFSALGAARFQGFNYAGGAESERVTGAMVSADLFPALGMAPLRGRVLGPEDDKPGADRTVVIGENFWQRRLGGRESILGEKIELSGMLYTVVGVMPQAFQYPSRLNELWVPLGVFADQFQGRGNHPGIYCVGRLKPGVSYEAGVADLKRIAAALATEYPAYNAHQSVAVQPLVDRTFGGVRPALYILLGAAGFVLLIACANVANLQLARAHGRSREFAVRAALGASRGRVIRQLLGESLLLGALGGIAGILVGFWALDALRAILPANIPRMAEVTLNGPVLAFALTLALLTSVLFGLVPAWHAARQDLRGALAQGPRAGGAAHGHRWRAALIVGEFALTCVLLVGAGLMLRTLGQLYRADPGFSTGRTLTASWVMPSPAYADKAKRAVLIERALERLAALPGVRAVGLSNPLPLSGNGNQNFFYVEGTPEPELGRQPVTEYFEVSPDFFAVLQIPLRAGRNFGPQDTPTAPKVAIIDTAFAEKHFKGQDPIGRRFVYGSRPPQDGKDWLTIVGVVAHIQNYGLGQPTREQSYVPHTQDVPSGLTFAFRTEQDPATLAAAVRAALHEVAPDLPLFGVQTMDELFNTSISTQRLSVVLLGTFAALALLLAAVGLYGVLTYQVSQRAREIAVRMALGATAGAVVGLVLRQGLKLAGVGLAIGLVASLALTQLLRRILFETSPFDPVSFAAVALVLLLIGGVACWLPARRATVVDPMAALRAE